jgi:hypothetical protein
MRTFIVILGSVVTAVTLAFGVFSAVGAVAREETTFPLTFDDDITSIRMDDGSGEVRIVGADVEQVSGERIVVEGLQRPTFDERVVDGVLFLESECPIAFAFHCGVTYELTVPRDLDLDIDSSGGGIHVEDLSGSVTLSSSGGGIRVVGASGTLTLDSSGGGIRVLESRSQIVTADSSGGGVRLEFADVPDAVDAESSGGGVRVLVPDRDGVSYAVDASSSGGGTDVEVATDPDSPHRIRAESSGGGVTVAYTGAN